MRSGFLDGLTRLVMLVLAGTVSLSIIGAIATMSEGAGRPAGFVVDSAPQPVATETNEAQPAPAEGQQRGGVADGGASGQGAATYGSGAATASDRESAKWLEVIAYVLFALAGLAALLALILWCVLAELRRAGDALERVAERR